MTRHSWISSMFIAVFLQPWLLPCAGTAKAQVVKHGRKTFSGPSDTEISYPVPEGTPAQKNPSALAEIKSYTALGLPPEGKSVDADGILTTGPAKEQEHYPVSIAIDSHQRFRLDVTRPEGLRSFRMNGRGSQIQQSGQRRPGLDDGEELDPLAFPTTLLELASREDAALVDDGVVTVEAQTMRKLTITLFSTRLGKPVGVALYFASGDHTLRKSAVIEHSQGNTSLEYLKVTTYGDYREEGSLILPHEFSETINGQPLMDLKVTSTNLVPSHDDSYFSF